jgi:hypothetical protein
VRIVAVSEFCNLRGSGKIVQTYQDPQKNIMLKNVPLFLNLILQLCQQNQTWQNPQTLKRTQKGPSRLGMQAESMRPREDDEALALSALPCENCQFVRGLLVGSDLDLGDLSSPCTCRNLDRGPQVGSHTSDDDGAPTGTGDGTCTAAPTDYEDALAYELRYGSVRAASLDISVVPIWIKDATDRGRPSVDRELECTRVLTRAFASTCSGLLTSDEDLNPTLSEALMRIREGSNFEVITRSVFADRMLRDGFTSF